jgi:hypothetical protein
MRDLSGKVLLMMKVLSRAFFVLIGEKDFKACIL